VQRDTADDSDEFNVIKSERKVILFWDEIILPVWQRFRQENYKEINVLLTYKFPKLFILMGIPTDKLPSTAMLYDLYVSSPVRPVPAPPPNISN
jgi:hypothetical protein